jgi:hypothetical protein
MMLWLKKIGLNIVSLYSPENFDYSILSKILAFAYQTRDLIHSYPDVSVVLGANQLHVSGCFVMKRDGYTAILMST